jgi:hypothetical protein
MPVPFDTHAVIQQLEHLGFSPDQAEGLSDILTQIVANQDYATTTDILAIRADIERVRAEIDAMRVATKADLTEVRLGLEIKIEAVKSDVTTLKWGMALVVGGVLSLVLKAFVHL